MMLSAWAASSVSARSPARQVVGFGVSNDVGFGNSVYVVGQPKDLGEWKVTNSIRLRYTTGNIWTGQVAIQAGTDVEYKFLTRNDTVGTQCDSNNGTYFPPGPNLTTNLPALPDAPYPGKMIFYYTGWTSAFVGFSLDGVNFTETPMSQVSTGRNANEFLYRIDDLGEAGETIQFYLTGYSNGLQRYENARYGGFGQFNNDFFTRLDAFVLQDGDLFNYWPPPSVSPSRVETGFVNSSETPLVISRQIKVYLPRGYNQNTNRDYPVVYMHDGNVVFTPDVSGLSGAGWEADKVADKEISQGRMRECIIVGVPNSPNRTREYLPPEDNSGGQGFGDKYGNFLIDDVKGTAIDPNYRTLPARGNTATIGASSGGLIASYLGWSTNAFGLVGAMSPAYLISPNFVTKIQNDPKQPLRIYTDISEFGIDASDLYPDYQYVYDLLLADGYAPNADLLAVMGCGHDHNEQAWHQRLTPAFRFLLNVLDEPNLLAQEILPLEVTGTTAVVGGVFTQSLDSLRGFAYRLERAASPTGTWSGVVTSAVESMPWSSLSMVDTNPPAPDGPVLYRTVAEPRP